MARDDADALDEFERQHKLGELVRRTRRAISMGRPDQAEAVAAAAAELAPDTTTVEELLGDVAAAHGRHVEARRHYERALAIEPSNADAEEKYGQAVLKVTSSTHLRERMERAVDSPEEYSRFRRSPVVAAFYSAIPGFGQLYNHQYEKGLAMAAGAMLLLAWVLYKLLFYSGASLILDARNPKLKPDRALEYIEGYGPLTWTLIVVAIVLYLAIWVYSIVDAYRVCTKQAAEADELGVEVGPGG